MSKRLCGFRTGKLYSVRFIAAAVLLGLSVGTAYADEFEINWTTSDLGSGSMLVDASLDSSNANGGYLISDIISGMQNGQPITGLLAQNTYGYNNNEIYPTGPNPSNSQIGLVDNYGFGFAVGSVDYDLFYDYGLMPPVYRLCISTAQQPNPPTDTEGCTSGAETSSAAIVGSLGITAVPVPLPAPAWLMLSCLGGLSIFIRRERNRAASLGHGPLAA